jgi:hypothetical protein
MRFIPCKKVHKNFQSDVDHKHSDPRASLFDLQAKAHQKRVSLKTIHDLGDLRKL